MTNKKTFWLIAVIIVICFFCVTVILYIKHLNNYDLVVINKTGEIKKGTSEKYWDFKSQHIDNRALIFFSVAHDNIDHPGLTPYAGISDFFLEFENGYFQKGSVIFNDNSYFDLIGEAELSGDTIRNIKLKISENWKEGMEYFEYNNKKIDIQEAEDIDVEKYFNEKVELLDSETEIPLR